MRNQNIRFDRKKHILYSCHGEKIIRKRLIQDYGEVRAQALWEQTQFQYAEFLKDAPDVGGKRNSHATGIYDSLLFFAYYTILPEKPSLTDLQPLSAKLFMASFKTLGKLFNMNRRGELKLLSKVFQKVGDKDRKSEAHYPDSFKMINELFDAENCVIRYRFTQCPNAEFAKAHGLSHVMPLLCNCDYIGMEYLHAGLIRYGTCMHGDCCDYCIVGDKNPLLKQHPRTTDAQGFWVNKG